MGSTEELHLLCTEVDNCQIRIVCHLCLVIVFVSWLFWCPLSRLSMVILWLLCHSHLSVLNKTQSAMDLVAWSDWPFSLIPTFSSINFLPNLKIIITSSVCTRELWSIIILRSSQRIIFVFNQCFVFSKLLMAKGHPDGCNLLWFTQRQHYSYLMHGVWSKPHADQYTDPLADPLTIFRQRSSMVILWGVVCAMSHI